MSSNELEERIYEALSKADVRPTSLVSETSRNLRPKYKVQVSSSSSHSSHSHSHSHSRSRSRSEHGGHGGRGGHGGAADRSESSITSEAVSSASASQSSSVHQTGSAWMDTLKQNWYIILAVLLLVVIGIFVYKKWTVIQTLGVGYGLLDAGVSASISETISGMPAEQMSGEVQELKAGTHPILDEKENPKKTTDTGKEKMIDNLIDTMKVTDHAPVDEVTAGADTTAEIKDTVETVVDQMGSIEAVTETGAEE